MTLFFVAPCLTVLSSLQISFFKLITRLLFLFVPSLEQTLELPVTCFYAFLKVTIHVLVPYLLLNLFCLF